MNNNIVISGIGIISSLGNNPKEFWNKRKYFNEKSFATYPIDNFNPKEYIKRKYIKNLDPVTRYCISASGEALKDSEGMFLNEKLGIIAGSMYHGLFSIFTTMESHNEGGVNNVSPLYFPGVVFNAASAQAAIEWGAKGPNSTINTGMSSGLSAIIKGIEYIVLNRAETMLCGGVEVIDEYVSFRFDKLKYITASSSNDFSPFNNLNKGLKLGEGACFFSIQKKQHAILNNCKTYAEIVGYGQTFGIDEYSIQRCINEATFNDHESIDLIILDSLGDVEYDNKIIDCIQQVFKNHQPYITCNTSTIGHTLGASGAFNLLEGVLSLITQEIAPIYNLPKSISRNLNFTKKTMSSPINKVLITSFDLNGNNTCIVLNKITR